MRIAPRRSVRPTLLALCLWLGGNVAAEELLVSVVTPQPVELRDTLELSGTVTARRQAMLSPRMDGLVAELLAEAGDTVEEGDLLLRLDTALAERQLALASAAIAEARAAAEEAARLVDEATRLRDDNFIPATDLASREAARASAVAALAAAQAQERLIAEELRRHALPAPFSGVIAERMTEAGEWVNRGTPVFRLVATDPVWVEVNVPQEYFSQLARDASIRIYPGSRRDGAITGHIVAMVPVSDVQARAFLVRIAADDPSGALFPGTSATAVMDIATDAGAGTALPREALLVHPDGGHSIFLIDDDNRAQRQRVRVDREAGGRVVLRDRLPEDARVALRGNQLLRDGDRVSVGDESR